MSRGYIRPVNWAQDEAWTHEKFPFVRSADSGGWVAVNAQGERVGIAVLGHVTHSSAEVEGHLTYTAVKLGLVEFVAQYAFKQLGLKRLYCQTSAINYRALRFIQRVGGIYYHTIPDGWDKGVAMEQFFIPGEVVLMGRR